MTENQDRTAPTWTVSASTHTPDNAEVTFSGKPSDEVRAALKAAGYRWFRARELWYGRADKLPKLLGDFYELTGAAQPSDTTTRDPGEDADDRWNEGPF